VDFLILPIEGSTPSSRELQSLRLDAGDQCLFVATNIADAVPAVRWVAGLYAPICPEHDPLATISPNGAIRAEALNQYERGRSLARRSYSRVFREWTRPRSPKARRSGAVMPTTLSPARAFRTRGTIQTSPRSSALSCPGRLLPRCLVAKGLSPHSPDHALICCDLVENQVDQSIV
jgi:hypothetical protein